MIRHRTLAAALVAGAIGVLALSAPDAGASEIKVEASIEPQIGLDEVASFTITITGGGSLDSLPQFALDNLKVVRGPSQSQNFSWVNGQSSSSLTLTWQMVPLKIGPASVHHIQVKLKDQQYDLPDQRVDVQQASPDSSPSSQPTAPSNPFDRLFGGSLSGRGRPAPQREAKLFLRAEAVPADPLVGQQVLYTMYLYTQADVSGVNPQVMPTFRGFWARDIPQPQRRLRPDMVDFQGERYARVALLQKALFPLAPGKIEIEPMRSELVVRVPSVGPFGELVPSMQSVDRISNGVTIEAHALPVAPPGFSGTVGKIKLDAKLEPAAVKAGEAATLTLTLSGQGNLQGVPDPALPLLDGVRAFPPQKSGSEEVQGTTVLGRRTWSFVLVPEHAGEWTLPAIEVPYFDPDSRSFKTAATAPQRLSAAGVASPPPVAATPPSAAPAPALPPSTQSPWLIAAGGAVGGALLVAAATWLLEARRRRIRSGAALRRLREQLEESEHEPRPRQAAELIEQAWSAFLTARWMLPAGLAAERWPAALANQDLSAESRADLDRLAADLHYLRHAPQLSSTEILQSELRDLSRRLARSLG